MFRPGCAADDDPTFHLSVFGPPNGFFREFTADQAGGAHGLEVQASYDESRDEIALRIRNTSGASVTLDIRDHYTATQRNVVVRPRGVQRERWSLRRLRGWYDLALTVPGDPTFALRYAGHLGNGEDSISDPGMGGLI
jgi:phospholipase C